MNGPPRSDARGAVRGARTALLLILFGLPPTAWAAYHCVPTRVEAHCPTANVYPTIQGAIDAAAPNDIIFVGRATYTGRVTVTKNLRFQCQAGALVTDEGLEPGDALVTYRGTTVKPQSWRGCAFWVATSAVGFSIPFSVGSVRLDNVGLRRIGDRAGVGILIDGSGGAPYAGGVSLQAVSVENFDVGARVINTRGLNLEPALFLSNRVGVHATNTAGQFFRNRFIANDIGLLWEGGGEEDPTFNGLDNNANDFEGNGIAVWIGMNLYRTEFNWNEIIRAPEQIAFRIERAPGVFEDGDQAYRGAVACHAQFGPTVVNGVKNNPTSFSLTSGC